MKKMLTFDIGGTFVKWGILNDNNEFLNKGKYPTQAHELGAREVIANVARKANELLEEAPEAIGVGISIPGVINSENGVFFSPTKNLPGSKDLNVIEVFKEFCDLPLIVINDANAATMGEKAIGGIQGVNNALFVIIGTGIGGGLVVDGNIYQGHNYSAGEIGRQIIQGKKWEVTSSTKALVGLVREALGNENITGEEIAEILNKGDNSTVNQIYNDWMERLAIGISNSIYNTNPEVVVLGGGYVENDNFKLDDLKSIILNITENDPVMQETKFIKASAGNDAALHGLGYLILNK